MATGSSVSARTDLLIAGGNAGSKLYDAHRLGVPILGEGHLAMLVAGQPLAAVMQCGEDLTVAGDGLVYVYDDAVFAQFT